MANNFTRKRIETYEDLIKFFEGLENSKDYKIRKGKNDESIILLNKNTKLVIVGTMVPDLLIYFYFGRTKRMYKWIDLVKGTKLFSLAEKGCVSEVKKILSEIGVCFLDVAYACCHKIGSSKDNDILRFVPDFEVFKTLKKMKEENPSLKIVSISQAANATLEEVFDIKNDPIRFFTGYPNTASYMPLSKIHELWENLFKQYL